MNIRACRARGEVCINQIPLCYIIGYNILRYQALPWHISYQETVCLIGGGALYSAFSTYPTENIRAMGISVQTLWVLVFRGVNDLPVEGSFRRNDPSLTNRIPNGSNGSTKTAACSGWEEPLGGTVLSLQALWFLVSGFCSESEVGGAPRCHALLWLTGGRPAMRSSPPGCRDPERKRRGSQHGCLVHRTPTGGAVACHAQALKG